MSKFIDALGLDQPRLLDGFTSNPRAGAMPVCSTCGALVSFESQQPHRDWHDALDGQARRSVLSDVDPS